MEDRVAGRVARAAPGSDWLWVMPNVGVVERAAAASMGEGVIAVSCDSVGKDAGVFDTWHAPSIKTIFISRHRQIQSHRFRLLWSEPLDKLRAG